MVVASAVYPCQCVIMKPGKKLRRAKVFFVGEVIEIGRNEKSDFDTVAAKFKVERYWKGKKEQFVTVVGAPAAAGECGLPVEVGKKYLIYAFKSDTQLESDFCVSRSLINATEDLNIIGRGKKLKTKK